MAIYTDIDLSFDKNIYDDVAILTDENSIKSTFKNNLMINYRWEKLQSNTSKLDMNSLVHSNDISEIYDIAKLVINECANLDRRIIEVLDINIKKNVYEYEMNVLLLIDVNEYKKINVGFSVKLN